MDIERMTIPSSINGKYQIDDKIDPGRLDGIYNKNYIIALTKAPPTGVTVTQDGKTLPLSSFSDLYDLMREGEFDKVKAALEERGYLVEMKKEGTGSATFNLSTVTDFALNVGKEAAQLQDQRFLTEYQAQVKQLQALKDINTALEGVNTAKAGDGKLSAATQTLLDKLNTEGKITLGKDWKLDDMTAEQLETLRSNLTTAQSSQSATNEEASMRLNEAANARSAIFTQLHTLLQTLMQATQSLARW